jgi:hypothetical protein
MNYKYKLVKFSSHIKQVNAKFKKNYVMFRVKQLPQVNDFAYAAKNKHYFAYAAINVCPLPHQFDSRPAGIKTPQHQD